MDFKKRIKTRLCVAVAEMLFAIAFIAMGYFGKGEQIGIFGLMLAVIALKNIRKNRIYLADDEKLKKEEVLENDERNIMIVNKARSLTFAIYAVFLAVLGCVLYVLRHTGTAAFVFDGLCILVLIYWICYAIICKRN